MGPSLAKELVAVLNNKPIQPSPPLIIPKKPAEPKQPLPQPTHKCTIAFRDFLSMPDPTEFHAMVIRHAGKHYISVNFIHISDAKQQLVQGLVVYSVSEPVRVEWDGEAYTDWLKSRRMLPSMDIPWILCLVKNLGSSRDPIPDKVDAGTKWNKRFHVKPDDPFPLFEMLMRQQNQKNAFVRGERYKEAVKSLTAFIQRNAIKL